jgi:hypothetical protein
MVEINKSCCQTLPYKEQKTAAFFKKMDGTNKLKRCVSYLFFRLLLNKKKITNTTIITTKAPTPIPVLNIPPITSHPDKVVIIASSAGANNNFSFIKKCLQCFSKLKFVFLYPYILLPKPH